MIPIEKNKKLNLAKLNGHVPAIVISQIPEVMQKFGINTNLRLAHFLAQCGHESAGFTAVREGLNYSAKFLATKRKKDFPTDALAQAYARQPEKIANRVYAHDNGNGTEASGDGWKYRGRGYIQLTGKDNYKLFGESLDKKVVFSGRLAELLNFRPNLAPENILEQPDLVATKYPLLSAAWFWGKNGLNKLADAGATDAVVTKITRRVNGGENGLDDRIKYFKIYYALLS